MRTPPSGQQQQRRQRRGAAERGGGERRCEEGGGGEGWTVEKSGREAEEMRERVSQAAWPAADRCGPPGAVVAANKPAFAGPEAVYQGMLAAAKVGLRLHPLYTTPTAAVSDQGMLAATEVGLQLPSLYTTPAAAVSYQGMLAAAEVGAERPSRGVHLLAPHSLPLWL